VKHRLKDIRLIVIDIDGTLVDTRGRVGEKARALAGELKKHKIFSTLSSARSYYYSAHIAEEMGIELPIITLDGALIKSQAAVVYKGIVPEFIISRAVEAAHRNYGKIGLCGEHNLYVDRSNSLIKDSTRLSAPVKEVESYQRVREVLEILIYCEDKASLHSIRDSFKFPYNLFVYVSVTKSPNNEYYLVTIKKKGSDKLSSLKRLVHHLGLKRKNVAVIGDWHNDMPLFEYGGFNIAVQNAIPELKRKADYITHFTNNEDAVGEVLEMVYKERVKTE